MRYDGVIKQWDDERGIGLIEPLPDGDPIPVHIAAFPRGQGRPRVRQRVSFEVERAHDGGKQARDVRIHETVRPPRVASRSVQPAGSIVPPLLACAAFAAAYAWAAMRWAAGPRLAIACLALSLLAVGLLAADRSAARDRRRLVPDGLWTVLALLGGWPGLLIGVALLGHLPGRRVSRAALWLAALLHAGAVLLWLSPIGRTLH